MKPDTTIPMHVYCRLITSLIFHFAHTAKTTPPTILAQRTLTQFLLHKLQCAYYPGSLFPTEKLATSTCIHRRIHGYAIYLKGRVREICYLGDLFLNLNENNIRREDSLLHGFWGSSVGGLIAEMCTKIVCYAAIKVSLQLSNGCSGIVRNLLIVSSRSSLWMGKALMS